MFTLCWLPFFNPKTTSSLYLHLITVTLSLTLFLAHLPSLLCVVVWMRRGAGGRGGGESVLRPLHVFLIPPRRPHLSSFGLRSPSICVPLRLISFSLFMSTKLPISLTVCLSAGPPVSVACLSAATISLLVAKKHHRRPLLTLYCTIAKRVFFNMECVVCCHNVT